MQSAPEIQYVAYAGLSPSQTPEPPNPHVNAIKKS